MRSSTNAELLTGGYRRSISFAPVYPAKGSRNLECDAIDRVWCSWLSSLPARQHLAPRKRLKSSGLRPDHRLCARGPSVDNPLAPPTWSKKAKRVLPCGCLERLFSVLRQLRDVLPLHDGFKSKKLIRELPHEAGSGSALRAKSVDPMANDSLRKPAACNW